MARSVILVVPAAQRSNANKVFDAWGRGPNTMSVPASPTGEDPPTHYFTNDSSMSAQTASTCSALPDDAGTLPEISGEWGEEGRISRASARAACAALTVGVSTNMTVAAHVVGILGGLGLQEIHLEI